jgi:hypothetical protein
MLISLTAVFACGIVVCLVRLPAREALNYTTFTTGESEAVLSGGGPGAWDEFVREKVQVLQDGPMYKMWYVGHSALGEYTAKVGYATSDDGKQWRKYPGNPILDRDSQSEDICVVKVSDSSYFMYVEVNDDHIDLYQSADGVTWTLYESAPIMTRAASPVVWIDSDIWFMLYERMVKEPHYTIALAMSADGISWVEHPHNPVLADDSDVVPDSLVKDGSTYHLYYHQKSLDRDAWPAMYATSTNLTTWTDRRALMSDFSSQYTLKTSNREVWSYVWYLVGDRRYYLRYGRDAGWLSSRLSAALR